MGVFRDWKGLEMWGGGKGPGAKGQVMGVGGLENMGQRSGAEKRVGEEPKNQTFFPSHYCTVDQESPVNEGKGKLPSIRFFSMMVTMMMVMPNNPPF